MGNLKEECEFAICLSMLIGSSCLIVVVFLFVELLMAAMALRFALPLHFFWVAKNGKLMRI